MLSLPSLAGRFAMDLGGGGCDERPPGPCAAEMISPYVSSAGGGGLCVGGGYVLSRATDAADGPRYLFDHIPPRLAPSGGEHDLLDLPAAGEDDPWPAEDVLCQPAAPPVSDRLGAGERDRVSVSHEHTNRVSGVSVSHEQEPESSVVSVSISGCSRLEQPVSVSAAEQRRPLHHSGGGLCVSEPARSSPQPEDCLPAIEIGLPPTCPPSCSGSIKLQISVPCNRATTVSVRGHPAHHPPQAAPHATACGPCAAPASPLPASPSRLPPSLRPCCGPAFGPLAAEAPAEAVAEDEMAVLARATAHLKESGWYYGMLGWQDAQECLRGTARGTFLARDSFDRRFLFALTVQTAQGPTSVRVQFLRGRFRLDAPAALLAGMPTFPDVNSLVEHYARHGHVLYDQKGRPLLKMRLVRPLRKEPPSLQHWCRLALNSVATAGSGQELLIPERLLRYVQEYPFGR